jgi:hypothetical protein
MGFLLKNIRLIFSMLLGLLLIDRVNNFLRFSSLYTDSDQTLLWHVAKDMLDFEYHGPCFYGQDYNPVFEPLFALPLISAGIDFPLALPIVTTIMGTFPFVLLAFYFYKKGEPLTGILPLIFCILLPPEYGMLASISRGFVAGVFFATAGLVLIVYHSCFLPRFIGGLLMGLGLYANPNCVLLFPILLPFISREKEKVKMLGALVPGLMLGVSSIFVNAWYYGVHNEMLIHGSIPREFSIDSFIDVTSRLDSYFNFVTPLLWPIGWISLLLLVAAAMRLWKYGSGLTFITTVLLLGGILLSFAYTKVADGGNSVFFSGARMYMAYPVILIFVFVFFLQTLKPVNLPKIYCSLLVLVLIAFSVKMFAFDHYLNNAFRGSKNSVVRVIDVKTLRTTCKNLLTFANGRTDLLISSARYSPNMAVTPVNYGCPCLEKEFPPTIQPAYERRYWIKKQIMDKVYHMILIHGTDSVQPFLKVDRKHGFLLVENRLKTSVFLEQMKIK